MELYARRFSAMSSNCEVQVVSPSRAAAKLATHAAETEVARIQAKYSRYLEDSVVSRINRNAGKQGVEVDAETAALIEFGVSCYRQSGGRFDLTSGTLRRIWSFRPGASPPHPEQIERSMSLIGWTKVVWNPPYISLPLEGMELDFGGIGKEYAADRAAAVCIEHGITGGLVNLGGDVRIIGPQVDGAPWKVGIADPRDDGKVVAGINVSEGAVATSGDSERYFEHQGKRYCHIFDALTGWPVEGAPRSVSVVAPLCIVAGGLSTLAMLSATAAETFLDEQECSFLIVRSDGSVAGRLADQRTPSTDDRRAPRPIVLE